MFDLAEVGFFCATISLSLESKAQSTSKGVSMTDQPTDVGATGSGPEPSPTGELTRGQELAGYRVRTRLGRGPRGELWSAVDPLTGAKGAVKVLAAGEGLDDWFAARAARPAEGLTRPLAVGQLGGGRGYVLRDFAPGRSLREICEAGLAVEDAQPLFDELQRLLEAAHGAGVVHGHLVADNIFVSPPAQPGGTPRLTITDAGLAGLPDEATLDPAADSRALARLRRQIIARRSPVKASARAALVRPGEPVVATEAPPPEVLERAPVSFHAPRRSSGAGWGLRLLLWVFLCLASVAGTYRLLVGSWPGEQRDQTREARLELRSTPPGATVFLDGRRLSGTTPLTTTVRPGRPYRLQLTHPGYQAYAQTVALGTNEAHRRLEVQLASRPLQWGTLKLSSDVQADFFLDDRCVGTQTTQVTLADVRAAMAHRLRVRAPGRRTAERTVQVSPGKVAVYDFLLERVPQLARGSR